MTRFEKSERTFNMRGGNFTFVTSFSFILYTDLSFPALLSSNSLPSPPLCRTHPLLLQLSGGFPWASTKYGTLSRGRTKLLPLHQGWAGIPACGIGSQKPAQVPRTGREQTQLSHPGRGHRLFPGRLSSCRSRVSELLGAQVGCFCVPLS